MKQGISVVINTLNEEKNIEKVIHSLGWADEIIICDMHSEDKTVELAKKLGARIVFYKREEYVEPARNFVVSKALNEWVLVLDADEEIPESLAKRLIEIGNKIEQMDYVRLPRKNIIFGHFMQATGWWPDYNIRFFKKGKVKWMNKIHRPPQTSGEGFDLPAEERYAIIHQNYATISQFLKRMDRYTAIQAKELKQEGYKFEWKDLFKKPLNEFLSRFFAMEGYKDGIHGLGLSFLQAFSFLIMYLKIWEIDKFKEANVNLLDLENQKNQSAKTINYWMEKTGNRGNLLERIFKKFKD